MTKAKELLNIINGVFHSDSDHDHKDAAAHRVHYLNGGDSDKEQAYA